MANKWIAFFSQTGTEIVDIAKSLDRWPDKIITNQRPEHLRKINDELLEREIIYLPNKPSVDDYNVVLEDNALVTLHGWLRVMPPTICEKFLIYNGHPGLITEYPELKGKDPQERAFEGKYKTAGSVIHEVVPEVDAGKILKEREVDIEGKNLDEVYSTLHEVSTNLWIDFLKEKFNVTS